MNPGSIYRTNRQERWWVALRGIIAILFGILAIVWPGMALFVLVYLFAAYALVDGIFAVTSSFQARSYFRHWWIVLIEGIAGIIFGILTFIWPGISFIVLLTLVGGWAIVTGILEIIAAIELSRAITGEWLLLLTGVLSILLGVLLFARPVASLLAIAWMIGIYAILFGILLLVRAFQRRSVLSY
ncbi:uncharacterized membrane protein HdeD (DUF308 family) [Thermosporothrix hazakensis]|uniref:Uncharacterized membrane protein HdeD (DUF308 family) n=1 Tax=Thermosporothrix hazakensis TaxID=644383 RepID=A0A326U713_THEHA|nr:HdeD family acid-resistance protein [Thermosporothrix hazakensis]PZW30517.1 uncharacterized membrane protein HdeD (DUF308 family) [Thermosporothrix hazakensis]GCE49377.1 membrane protein [Thermosporothrix hazakensis]